MFAVAALPATAAETDLITQEGFGCREKAGFSRAVEFASADDQVAFKKFLQREIAAGNCRLLHKGDSVFVEDLDMKGMICARPKGEINCLWTGEEIVK